MVDFRFHLISLVAVFLALAIGIMAGSGFIGDALVEDIDRRLGGLQRTNAELRSDIDRLDERLDAAQRFASEVQPILIDGALAGERVALVTVEGTAASVTDTVAAALERAEADVSLRIELGRRFALENQAEIDQLALILRSTEDDPELLRIEAGATLGQRIAGAADARSGPARERLVRLLRELSDAGFATVSDGAATEAGATRLVLAVGDPADAPFDPRGLSIALAGAAEADDTTAVVAEGVDSTWGVVLAVRDSDVAGIVSTVDNVDELTGSIAMVMVLDAGDELVHGHYGRLAGADAPIPDPVLTPEE